MNDIRTILLKEWKCFTGSDKGVYILYVVLIISWSFFLAGGDSANSGPLWLVFFSVVIAANFSNTVFISERISGALEVLITSGLSRNSILFGKMFFVMAMTLVIGAMCIGLAGIWHYFIYDYGEIRFRAFDLFTYTASAFVNIAGSAFLSVRMSNPRLLQLANLFILACIITGFTVLTQFYYIPEIVLPILLTFIGIGASILAKKEFNSERILQPVIF